MRNFKGPKFQQGKVGVDREPKPDCELLAKMLARKAKVTNITIGEEEFAYVYLKFDKEHGSAYINSTVDKAREAFERHTGKQAIFGIVPLEFTNITTKDAFKLKLNGTAK